MHSTQIVRPTEFVVHFTLGSHGLPAPQPHCALSNNGPEMIHYQTKFSKNSTLQLRDVEKLPLFFLHIIYFISFTNEISFRIILQKWIVTKSRLPIGELDLHGRIRTGDSRVQTSPRYALYCLTRSSENRTTAGHKR